MTVKMRIQGLMLDPFTNMPLLVLRDPQTDAKLPIWVAVFEADAIATELERVTSPRPKTHDLLRNVMQELGGTLERITVTDLDADGIFYALLAIRTPNGTVELDARPSDAVALALRCDAPIFAEQSVIDAAQRIDLTQGHKDSERLRAWLHSLSETEIGKYEV